MININRKAGIVLLLIVGVFSCQKENMGDDKSPQVESVTETIVKKGIENLYLLGEGETQTELDKADAVFISLVGGPTMKPRDTDFREHHEGFTVIYIKQAQVFVDEFMITKEESITSEKAVEINTATARFTYEVAKHFKDKGKKVYLVGHSFGAFLIPYVLELYGVDLFERIVVAAGRMKMEEKVWDAFEKGIFAKFIYDNSNGYTKSIEFASKAIDDYTDKEFADLGDFSDQGIRSKYDQRSMMMLQSNLGKRDYTQKLMGKTLSKLLYIYGQVDAATGRLEKEETDMLTSSGATVKMYEAKYDDNNDLIAGGHGLGGSSESDIANFLKTGAL